MSTVPFDTHKFVKHLEACGVPATQAEAILAAFQDVAKESALATQADISELKSGLMKWIMVLALTQLLTTLLLILK